MAVYIAIFVAGLLTILLPCILPLIPIVLGVSIAGKSKWRPLLTVAGMLASFVGFTFLLLVVLRQFVEVADYMRIGTYYLLLLFGLGFVTHNKVIQIVGAVAGGFFFWDKGIPASVIAAIIGVVCMYIGGAVASRIQQFGGDVQSKAREELGADNPFTAFFMGLTMGLVWVPCAGPALGFAFTLVREQPGLQALLSLTAYGVGTAIPLLLIGYGGQAAVHSVRALAKYSGVVKQVSGVLLIVTALLFQFRLFQTVEIWLVQNTPYGNVGVDIERRLFEDDADMFDRAKEEMNSPSSSSDMTLPVLPKITRAPEFAGLGPWHNSEPFTMESLRGKVVLVDFWTYSCINCIRTLPYIQGYWDKFGSTTPFVLIGVHTPEFVFEKSEKNVADAIERHGLTYPVAQDNDFETWKAFANRYWPAKYLIDAEGYIRYTHFGEGAYDETDKAIQSLLAEMGVDVSGEAVETVQKERRTLTPEIYVGSRSWPALQNAQGDPSDAVVTYAEPSELSLHRYGLVGDWQLADEEHQVLRSDSGEIRMRFLGGEINLVMGHEGDGPVPIVQVLLDGEEVKTFAIDRQDLFELFKGEYGEHEIILRIQGAGAQAYAFTFGV